MVKLSHLLPVLLLTTVAISASAQRFTFSTTPVLDATGKPVPVSRYMHVKGTPYLFDEWLPGEIVTQAGKLHKGMLLKYNIETNLLTFAYKPQDEPLKFAEPIAAFNILANRKMSFANNFPKIDGYGKDSYYEVLALGKTTLLKHYRQLLKDTRSADLSMTDGTYVQRANYYIYKDGKMERIKPNVNTIQTALADKAAQVDSFVVAKNIKFENEEDLKKVFDYYNGL